MTGPFSTGTAGIRRRSISPRSIGTRGPSVRHIKRVELPYEGRNHAPEYSPDGKRLAYIRQAVPRMDSSNTLCVYSPETGEERKTALNLKQVSSWPGPRTDRRS
ncbi:MAG: hypothetical protein MZV63_14235 [Marinilabiliales bacterium]|nr:hypothetical protein [Marinilabiliales bacterium]